MVLGGAQSKSELSSSFAQFWKLLEGMLDQLSQPVAFATAPLKPAGSTQQHYGASPSNGSSDGDAEVEDHSTTSYPPPPPHNQLEPGEPDAEEDDWEVDSEGRLFFLSNKFLSHLLVAYL